jgi:hypothetical protein
MKKLSQANFSILGYVVLQLSSCGIVPPKRHHIDEKMASYIDQFLKEARNHQVEASGDNLDFANVLDDDKWDLFMTKKSLDVGTVGLCEKADVSYKEQGFIMPNVPNHDTITSVWILGQPDTPMSELVTAFHELGHCILGLPHIESRPDIMNAVLPTAEYASEHWPELLRQLFNESQNDPGLF